MKRIFISSVQKEFERERAAIKRMIESDPFVQSHYHAFVFEIDAQAADKSTQQVYLNEIEQSDVYLLLVGDKYGYEDADGISPTEREYDRAVERGLPILVFVKGSDGSCREEKERLFLDKVSSGRTRVRFQPMTDPRDLLNEVRGSIRELMMDEGLLSELPFEDQQPHDTTLIEVISPGRLTPPLTIDMLYGKHESVAPNPHIARAMFWVKYIETVGTGLNDLLDSCAAAGLKRPTLEATDLYFRVIIWRSADKQQINADKQQIKRQKIDEVIPLLVNNANYTIPQIADKLQISVSSVRTHIEWLKREKGLVHVGPRKTGHWSFQQKSRNFHE